MFLFSGLRRQYLLGPPLLLFCLAGVSKGGNMSRKVPELLYFAYGSNLLESRIHMNNPTAIRYSIGKLENFQLDFATYSKRWKGAAATIVPKTGGHVWGAVYSITEQDVKSLDKQEGVHLNMYRPLHVDVKLENGSSLNCRTYQQCNNPDPHPNLSDLPDERRPSKTYLRTIIAGAEESNLPQDYRHFLATIKHNDIDERPEYELEK